MPTSSTRTTPPTATQPDPAVVLVPGLGLDARSWTAVRARLPGRTVVVRLPSMGLRAPRGTDLRVERQSERLREQLDAVNDVVLVGHSASCPVVADVALRRPGVLGLVLVGPVTDPSAATWPRMLASWVRTATHERLWEVPVLAPQYRSTGVTSMLRGMDRIRSYRTDALLTGTPVRTRIVRGQHDRIAGARWCERLAVVSGGQLVTAPGAGHMVPLTHPEVVAATAQSLGRSGRGVAPEVTG